MTLTPDDAELVASVRMIADCADGDSSREWYATLMEIRNLSTYGLAYYDTTAGASGRRRWPWISSTRRSRLRPGRPWR